MYNEETLEGEYGVPSLTEQILVHMLLAVVGAPILVLFITAAPFLMLYNWISRRFNGEE